ncbi:MAG: alpha-L-fucosidase [Bacteroidales bacterium]|nr:alpha-L-fucosidase [Bacteroidales bacterium]
MNLKESKKGKKFLVVLLFVLVAVTAGAQQKSESKMEWFENARLGIFIHWGIYSVNGIDESWSFFNGYIPYDEYMKQLNGFTASSYDPEAWVRLIRESGAKYAVLTTKHHDGVALWDTKLSRLNVVDSTPAERDLIKPFVRALRKADLKVGLYYSLLDWSHPDYPNFTGREKRYESDSARWERFVKFNHGQINEIAREFSPDLYWFDGDWEQSAERWRAPEIRKMILDHNPSAIINSRLAGYGDYATPEQGLPSKRPADKHWELCMTINDSWGYQGNDTNYKSSLQVIRIFAECIGMGGNLLLDIGPEPDGTIPEEQQQVLRDLGRWTSKHKEAIYGTRAGLPEGHFDGPSTMNRDSTMVYLFFTGDAGGELMLEGVKNRINKAVVIGNGTSLEVKEFLRPSWSSHAGVWFIKVPEEVLDEKMTVVGLSLSGKLKLE